MPNLMIYGVPNRTNRSQLITLKRELMVAVAGIKALELTPTSVTPRFIPDLVGDDEPEICVVVDGLFVKPKRTDDIRQQLCEVIADVMMAFASREIPDWRTIEVYTRSHAPVPHEGFVSHTPSRI